MCQPAQCSICEKFAWRGCGLHIPQALSSIPKENWCNCLHSNGEAQDFPPRAGTGIGRSN